MNRSELFEKTDDILREKSADFREKELERIAALYRRLPRLKAIEDDLKNNMSRFTAFAFSGNRSEEAFNEFRKKSLDLQKERASILAAEGLPEDSFKIHPRCEKCEDRGYTDKGFCECFKLPITQAKRSIRSIFHIITSRKTAKKWSLPSATQKNMSAISRTKKKICFLWGAAAQAKRFFHAQ